MTSHPVILSPGHLVILPAKDVERKGSTFMKAIMTRQLGKSGITVSALGMGCWAIGGEMWYEGKYDGWGTIDDHESIRAIQRAVDLGVTFFDTSDVYGTGHSERILAQGLQGRRHEVVIATKFGFTYDEASRRITGTDLSPAYIRRACEASLRRLQTDHIDLYQLHCGATAEQIESVVETLEGLVAAGHIRAYGWSTDNPALAKLFVRGAHCAAIQHGLNVFTDAKPILDLCEQFDLASVNNAPLASGLLSGKYTADSVLPANDHRSAGFEWAVYFNNGRPNPEFLQKLAAVREILTSDGRTLAQGALAWIWARSNRTIPIPGFKTVAQVEENCGALQFDPLTPQQMDEIKGLLG
jgi:aryl-alcohol dehydrogenase-like predicted oxidoreductase